MIAPTHIAIAVACGMIAGSSKTSLALMAAGSVLPDLDHPQSFIGRILFPISIPLNHWLGHRGAMHSFWLWSFMMLLGIFWLPALFIGAGGLLHVFSDCATASGVRALSPWTQRLFVIFRSSWRIKTGSPTEIVLLIFFGLIAWSGSHISALGGIKSLVGYFTGSPKIMMEEYRAKGLTKCHVEGKLRWINGKIDVGKWLIIGLEGQNGLALQGKDKIIHLPGDGKFLKARLKAGHDKWKLVMLRGWAQTQSDVYFLDGKIWHHAKKGDTVWGQIIGGEIELVTMK